MKGPLIDGFCQGCFELLIIPLPYMVWIPTAGRPWICISDDRKGASPQCPIGISAKYETLSCSLLAFV